MKTLRLFPIVAVLMAVTTVTFGQTKTEKFKVSGNCGMCKTKIEKAAKEGGAKEAKWDEESKELTVTYESSSTNTAKIQEKIAFVGYDNAGAKATAAAYNKLHGCCKYDRTDTKEASCCSDGEKCTDDHGDKPAAKADCCKDGKCPKAGHDGKDCCKKDGAKMPARKTGSDGDCCKDGKCTKEGHNGADCCKKS